MDEPTSGLDARSAKLIMNGVRKIADSGRTIVCTIHQPSTEVFNLFDSLLLLRRGGRMVFFGELGEDSKHLIDYFEAFPDVKPITPGYNPATWMLECIGAGVGGGKSTSVPIGSVLAQPMDFAERFVVSD
ncbi:hypothetical protein PR001_g28354 [Phytophthora rubi]|nr:hypothetical protein PR001_g28354 [Phytophthora rubi]